MSTEKDIAERLRAAFVQHHGNKVGDPFVSQIAREIAAVASGPPGYGETVALPLPADDRARIRNEALEEAAMIFDELAEIETTAAVRLEEDDEADDADYHHDNARHAAASAVRIRSLKTKDA